MKSLGISIREISIKDACIQHFKDIDHNINVHDVTYENSQARERTQILMDVANQTWGMVIGTGDLSELALGWATYNGDHMSMYGVNASVPKTLVKYLVQWVAVNGMDENSKATLLDIVDTPISPELIPADENGEIKQKQKIWWVLMNYMTSSYIISYVSVSGLPRYSIWQILHSKICMMKKTSRNGFLPSSVVSLINSSSVLACRTVLK